MRQLGFSSSARDWRIDVWRGLAVLMIFVNHLGPNALAMLTTRHWGFSDAAELFVFLSGISTARVLERFKGQSLGPLRWTLRRAVKLYGYHWALFLALGVMCAGFFALTDSYGLIDSLQYAPFFAHTETVLIRVATLTFLPSYADILPLYIVLTVLVGVLFTITRARMPAVAAISLSIYLAARAFEVNFPADEGNRRWFFNPFTWQFLFIAGMAAWTLRTRDGFQRFVRAPAALCVSALFLGFAVVPTAPWTLDGALPGWRPFADHFAPFLDKQNLSPLRIMHFLAAAHLGYVLLPMTSRLQTTAAALHLALVGRHALNMFILGSILTSAALAADLLWGHTFAGTSLMSAVGIGLILGCAKWLEALRTAPRYLFRGETPVQVPAE